MEPHWNPSVEQQALARIYRMGQKRKVTTIRYIMRNSFEDVRIQQIDAIAQAHILTQTSMS
jgi:SNF2 family DNA or RNA helicase